MASFIQNLDKETADGNFFAMADQPRSMREWVQEVRKVRQLDHGKISDGMLEAKLKSFANAKRDFEPARSQNKGLPTGVYKCMFVGVWNGDYSLYRNVSEEFNKLLNAAVQTTRSEVSQFKKDLVIGGVFASTINITWPMTLLSFILISIRGIAQGIRWALRIKDYGQWDYKRNPSTSFGKANSHRSSYSLFFYYSPPNGKAYKHAKNTKNIMRFDDPGNLIYAATGAEICYLLADDESKKVFLKGAAESYAAGEGSHMVSKMVDGLGKGWEAGAFDTSNLDVALFDGAHDIAVINWGYDAYADGTLKNIMTPLDFRKALKFLQKKDT
ncbi:MAG: hypothetical protein ACRCVN_00840 [Spirochaetia bacterium]